MPGNGEVPSPRPRLLDAVLCMDLKGQGEGVESQVRELTEFPSDCV